MSDIILTEAEARMLQSTMARGTTQYLLLATAISRAKGAERRVERSLGRHVAVPVCGSTGPRIEDVRPRCGQDLGHGGFHRGFIGSGFEHEQWSGPLLRDEDFALSYRGPRG